MQQSTLISENLHDTVYNNRYVILSILLVGIFMAVLDSTMISIALPTITKYFSVDIVQSQWAVTGYLLAMTGLFIFFGKASEYVGKARLFIAGWAIFTISSLACGLAPGLNELIAFRIVQGIGASMVSSVGGALIFLAFPPQERGRAMGYFGAVFAIGALVGPGLGGFIVDNFGWQYTFLVNVPLGVLLLACALMYFRIPETTSKSFEMDWVGAGTLFISIVSLMMFCSEIANSLAINMVMTAYGAIFLLSLAGFIFHGSRCEKPLLDLSIFRNKNFTLPIISAMLLFASISIANTLQPFYFQFVMGYTPSQVGLLSMVVPLFMVFSAPAGGWMYDKYHSKYGAAWGLIIATVGFMIMVYAFLTMTLWLIIAAFILRGIGGGIFSSPNNIETMSSVSREKTAIASSVLSTANYLALMLGVAISSILLTADLNMSGHYGQIFTAGQSLLSNSIGTIMVVAVAMCILSTVISVMRNIRVIPADHVEQAVDART